MSDQKTGGLFCGEALGVPWRGAEWFPLPGVAPPSFDMEAYFKTLERLKGLRPRLLFYSHDGVGRDSEKLISIVAQNTRILGDIVLEVLKKGESLEVAGHKILQYISTTCGLGAEETDTGMLVSGYAVYFQKAGLLM